ncbi:cupin domain-containing protein [Lactiplantibacillus pentosus]|uniref:cupin domain-containing protein n=1 Tax=Lactiplantibacillus pentosus TaxID=1589 RepID=UPI0013308A18|nr:cupin domain-containing protein [Lactiplantibacillus pentosus]MBQ0838065.1 cupin domain-containing protein [Lactiplantibacillus pentosus]MBU7466038.1 cupin domain-containing protein [Lactiplantibacillus pentosus]MBU7491873.1 cupin domain-containing protein [Lactiplantibacillus pentosus]MBU7495195.1 cupin domain-containing protein [Lactiplantibacillus pentosus]MBU7521172.1 cupin domain-containing protein [Lactiplantibacillus pentosus]
MPVTKIKLHETMTYREHAITSKSFSRKLGIDLPFAMYAMAAGESISAEQSTLTRLFEVVDGTLTVQFADESQQTVATGEMLVVPANTVHTLLATQPCQFIQLETK